MVLACARGVIDSSRAVKSAAPTQLLQSITSIILRCGEELSRFFDVYHRAYHSEIDMQQRPLLARGLSIDSRAYVISLHARFINTYNL